MKLSDFTKGLLAIIGFTIVICIYIAVCPTETGYYLLYHPIEEQLRDKKFAMMIFGSIGGVATLLMVVELWRPLTGKRGKY